MALFDMRLKHCRNWKINGDGCNNNVPASEWGMPDCSECKAKKKAKAEYEKLLNLSQFTVA